MFGPLTIPFGAKMLINMVRLKPEYSLEDAELALGEMCNVVKNTYAGDGGFIAGQVFSSAGFVSKEGTMTSVASDNGSASITGFGGQHVVIITYWSSFDQHETSHGDP